MCVWLFTTNPFPKPAFRLNGYDVKGIRSRYRNRILWQAGELLAPENLSAIFFCYLKQQQKKMFQVRPHWRQGRKNPLEKKTRNKNRQTKWVTVVCESNHHWEINLFLLFLFFLPPKPPSSPRQSLRVSIELSWRSDCPFSFGLCFCGTTP